MPRNPDHKRLEVLLSQEQYNALAQDAKIERKDGDMAAHVRSILEWAIPSFGDAEPLPERGKYDRRDKAIRLELGANGYVLPEDQEDEAVAEILATADQYKSLDDAIEAWKEREVRS